MHFVVVSGNKGVAQEVEPNQDIAYYEVALGTDVRFPLTRTNVVPFTNVYLNTTVTFTNLALEAGYGIYFFTVKAYSSSYSTATVTSNGFYVNSDGGVTGNKLYNLIFVRQISMTSFH